MYRNAFLELADPANDLFHMDARVPRIKTWQDKISPYVSNDTSEDMSIKDQPQRKKVSNPCKRIKSFFCKDYGFGAKMTFLSRYLESSHKKVTFLLQGLRETT